MKYPIDAQTTEELFGHLIAHNRSQNQMIQALTILLQEAMETSEMADEDGFGAPDWYYESKKIIDIQKKLKVEHENRIFNEKNGLHEKHSPMPITLAAAIENDASAVPNLGLMGLGQINDPQLNANINEREKSLGEEMSEEELSRHFREKNTPKMKNGVDLSKKEPFKGMTLEEIKEWETKQDNSNDIYKIKARVQNAVTSTGGSLTAVGEMLCNSFVHVAKDLYDFADMINDKSLRIQLIERVRKHESMPANLIATTSANVRVKK